MKRTRSGREPVLPDWYSPENRKNEKRQKTSHLRKQAEWQNEENKVRRTLSNNFIIRRNTGGNSKGFDVKGTDNSDNRTRFVVEYKLNNKAQIGNYIITVNELGIVIGIRKTRYIEKSVYNLLVNKVLPHIIENNVHALLEEKTIITVNCNLVPMKYTEKNKNLATPEKKTPIIIYIVGDRAYSLTSTNPNYYDADTAYFRISKKKDKFVLRAFVNKPKNRGLSLDELPHLLI